MTEAEAAELLRDAPCQLRHNEGRRHASLATWAPHVRCIVAALAGAGLLEAPCECGELGWCASCDERKFAGPLDNPPESV